MLEDVKEPPFEDSIPTSISLRSDESRELLTLALITNMKARAEIHD
jgi:hypothetical protein